MESNKRCSGICTKSDKFIFTDIEGGVPIHSCGWVMTGELVQEVEEQRLIAAILLFVTSITSVALYLLIRLHPNINDFLNKQQEKALLETTFNMIDSKPILVGLDQTRQHERYH